MSRKNDIKRRDFLKATGAGATLAAGGVFSQLDAQESKADSQKLNIACVGTANRAAADISGVKGENIVALCDIDSNYLERAGAQFPGARRYADYREMIDKEAGQIDAVVVATADHNHAPASIRAIRAGKHVYCEKPLTHTVHESRVIAEAAKKYGVATQLGTQIHAGDNYRRVVELVQTGAIGDVSEVHVWVGRAWGWQPSKAEAEKHRDIVFAQQRPAKADPIPPGLNWDLWLGPAPKRAFNNVYFPGPKWYRWWDFGNGTMSDLGSHWIDLPFWALKLKAPLTVEADGPSPNTEIAPASMMARYEYGPRGDLPAVDLSWYQGTYKPKILQEQGLPQWGSGVLFVGSKGMLLADYGKHTLLPEKQFEGFERPKPFIPKSIGHHAEWVHACKTGDPTTCNFEYAGWLTEANHLGNVAYRAGQKLEWNARKMKATNCPEADRFIGRSYRDGWKLG